MIGPLLITLGTILAASTILLGLGNKIEARIFGLKPLVIGAALILIGRVL